MPIVKMPDGTQVRFPDEMPKEQIRALILQKFPDVGNPAPQQDSQADPNAQAVAAGLPVADPSMQSDGNSPSPAFQQALAQLHQAAGSLQDAPTEDRDRLVRANMEATKIQNMQGDKGLLRRAAEAIPGGATGGFADELYSGTIGGLARMARDGVGYGEAYKREQALAAAQKRKRGNAANIIGDVAGGLALGAGATAGPLTMTQAGTVAASRPAWGGLTLTGRASSGLGKTAAAMGEGAGYGGLYGAGNAKEGERLKDAGWGAATGAATGGLLEGAGNVASRLLSPKGPAAQSAAELAQEGNALFDAAKNAGVTVKPSAIDHAAGNVAIKLKSFGFDKELQPKTAIVAKRLLEARKSQMSISELHNLRKKASNAAREADDKSDRAAAGIIVEQIDNIIGDVANFSANSGSAVKSLQDGIKVWKRQIKTEALEDMVEKAQNQATGFENGLVIQFRQLANNKNRMRSFSKQEQKMIKSVVRRGSAHGVLRALGMLSPGSTFGGLVTGGTAVGSGILPGAALAATGAAAKAGAGALTRGKVNAIQRAVSTGQLPMLTLPNYLRPAIGGATAGTVEMRPQGLLGSR